jgi:hypothetical protein
MVRKLGELPKVLLFNSGIESIGISYVFAFYLLLFTFIQISIFTFFELFTMGLEMFLCLCLRWN